MPGEARAEQQILTMTELGHKTYAFDSSHDASRPAQWWFQESDEGLVLFVVLYTQACRWSKCLGCNLPSRSSLHHVGFRAVIQQVDHLLASRAVAARAGELRKVIVSNNGSVLDEHTFPTLALMYLITQICLQWPTVRTLCLETRPEYVDWEEMEWLARALAEKETPGEVELAVGFEAYDEHVRNGVMQKGLHLTIFESMVEKMARYGFRLKCYVMQKPGPSMRAAAGGADVQASIQYLAELAASSGIHINVHLNPTYVAGGTRLEEAFVAGRWGPPTLVDVARAVLAAEGTPLSVFVGLSDEGLAVPGGSFVRPGDERAVELLETFNRNGDYALVRAVANGTLTPA